MRLSRNSLQLIPDKAIANFRCMQIQLYSEVDNYERGSKAYRFSNNGYVKKDIAWEHFYERQSMHTNAERSQNFELKGQSVRSVYLLVLNARLLRRSEILHRLKLIYACSWEENCQQGE